MDVEIEPVFEDDPHGLAEFRRVGDFLQVGGGAELVGLVDVVELVGACQHNNGKVF